MDSPTARLQPASLLTSPSPAHRCTAVWTHVMDSPDCTTPACVTAYITIPSTPLHCFVDACDGLTRLHDSSLRHCLRHHPQHTFCTAVRTRVMDSPDCTTPACVTAYVTIPSTPLHCCVDACDRLTRLHDSSLRHCLRHHPQLTCTGQQ
ncbi:hypothetical protein NDU88_004040 [Pleurodeles waltl]|uniref:C2H2-type domain-containing protein n=1 Tax=Pleurodeles waltl TaxID=8319 RepID=A0AAV7M6Q9_PLEWA|nr:hypothetical protein NDU88_004040 [Pleurodeles waltl]